MSLRPGDSSGVCDRVFLSCFGREVSCSGLTASSWMALHICLDRNSGSFGRSSCQSVISRS
jgi:hypothetical protein